MKSQIYFLIKYFLFWIGYFFVLRLLFTFYHFNLFSELTLFNKVFSFVNGLRIDASMTAYICTIPFLFSFLFTKKGYNLFLKIYSIFILLLSIFIVIADLELYNAWKYRMEYSAIDYLKNINEATASMQSSPILLLLALMVFLFFLSHYIYKKIFSLSKIENNINIKSIGLSLLMTAILILPMRGGIGIAPLNPSAAYFSNQPFANHNALNVVWNFMFTAINKKVENNPFIYMSDEIAKLTVDNLYKLPASQEKTWIKNKKANVLIVVWESFTAKVIDEKHHNIEITPNFNKWKNKGVYFANAYASGDRTEKGIAAILSGYPAQPITSIVKETTKAASLPILSKTFRDLGYQTAFYYGGDLSFANMKAYLLNGQFHTLVSKSDFNSAQSNTKWGAHDHYLFEKYLTDNKTKTSPFFDVVMTLSSHEPFETPIDKVINGDDVESKFFNSLHYTDQSVGNFLDTASKLDWWENTVVIVVADHGHQLPKTDSRIDDFHIPILWTGGAIDTSFVINEYVSQIDIPKTLLSQFDIQSEQYIWSKHYVNTNNWAYFAFNNGFGFVDKDCKVLFDNPAKKIVEQYGNCVQAETMGKAMVQKTFEDYLKCGNPKK